MLADVGERMKAKAQAAAAERDAASETT
jgi:hypothetical protein